MELEHHQLDLRYEALRRRNGKRERQLLSSLAEVGQQLPILVVAGGDGGRLIVIDGYKRVRALRRLKQDVVRATQWAVEEAEALLLERMMRSGEGDGALEQGWLMRELEQRFQLSQQELARRFDKSQSWVSRRLALVLELPEPVQARVRAGELMAHAAEKYLVPMARANAEAAVRLAAAITPLKLSTRQVGQLYAGWQGGNARTRELIETQPAVYLKATEHAQRQEPTAAEQVISDLQAMAGIARRQTKRLRQGVWQQLSSTEQAEAARCGAQARADTARLYARLDEEIERTMAGTKESNHAGRAHAHGDPAAA